MEQKNGMQSLQFMPIGETKEMRSLRKETMRIQKIEQAKAKKSQIILSLKKFSLMASIGSAISLMSLYGAKTGVDNLIHQYQVEKEFNGLETDVQRILKSNSNMVLKQRDGETVWESQYDHLGIAKSIKDFENNNGKVSASALTAMLMNSIEESGYQNMDLIIHYLVDNEEIKTVEDYVHSKGYASVDDYQNAMREAYYDEIQKEEIRADYFSDEGRGR